MPDFWGHKDDADVIKFLIDSGADVNVKDQFGWFPLHHAASLAILDVEILKYLIEKGADVNVLDDDGKTPFDYANDAKKEILRKAGGKSGAEM